MTKKHDDSSKTVKQDNDKDVEELEKMLDDVKAEKDNDETISKLLLEQLINETTKLKKEKISLEVNENNTIAINLYKKYNFIKEGLRKKYYNN